MSQIFRLPEEMMATPNTTDDPGIQSGKVGPDDPRYAAVVEKRFNKRFRRARTTSGWSARPNR